MLRMPILANNSEPEDVGLNPIEWSRARRQLLITGKTDHDVWVRMNRWQRDVYHQIELGIASITDEDMENHDLTKSLNWF